MAKLAAKVYGDALFQLAVEDDKVDVFLEEAREIQQVLLASEELTQFMEHPSITKEKKISLIEELLLDKISKDMIGFLVIVIEKGHYDELQQMMIYFEEQVKEYKKIGVVYITTPQPLREEQKQQVQDKILGTTKYTSLECHYEIDAALMGGMIIRMKDRVIDSSLKTKLENLSKELLKLRVS